MRRAISTLGGALLGVALSQFPEYAQQYTQRLGGAVDELRVITEEFDSAALAGGLDRPQALARYEASADPFLADRGTSMNRTFLRYEQLSATLAQIQGASAVERLQLLPRYLDSDIGARTIDNFKPAIPVTPEGFAYAGAGFIVGYGVLSSLYTFVMMPFRRRRVRIVYRDRLEPPFNS